MVYSCKLVYHKSDLGYLSPMSQRIMCSRSSCTSAPLMALPTMIPALKLKKPSAFPSRLASDFFANSGLRKLNTAAMEMKGGSGGHGGVLTSTCSVSVSGDTLRWVFTGAAALLMLVRNTAIKKPFLVPLLALQAPRELITWIRGEYGMWATFLALLVRLFYYIPGELELPLTLVLLVITAPYQAMDLRGTTEAMIACACVAAFLAYQHFTRAGGLRGSFKEGSFLATIAVICLVGVPFVFLLGGF